MKGSQEAFALKGLTKKCYCCEGTKHAAAHCKYKQDKYHACGKVGQIARACGNKNTQNQESKRRCKERNEVEVIIPTKFKVSKMVEKYHL